jgi:hypothetical protein
MDHLWLVKFKKSYTATSGNLRPGGFAEYAILEQDLAIRIPAAVPLEDAATLPLCSLTAAQVDEFISLDIIFTVVLCSRRSSFAWKSILLSRVLSNSKPQNQIHPLYLSIQAPHLLDFLP